MPVSVFATYVAYILRLGTGLDSQSAKLLLPPVLVTACYIPCLWPGGPQIPGTYPARDHSEKIEHRQVVLPSWVGGGGLSRSAVE